MPEFLKRLCSAFQSTLPCGSDAAPYCMIYHCSNFNPRSLAGATVDFILPSLIIVFQSTLTCGSDAGRCSALPAVPNFNPRSLAGATCAFSAGCQPVPAFQSTLPCGSDALRQLDYLALTIFQSTLPCGSDTIGHQYNIL